MCTIIRQKSAVHGLVNWTSERDRVCVCVCLAKLCAGHRSTKLCTSANGIQLCLRLLFFRYYSSCSCSCTCTTVAVAVAIRSRKTGRTRRKRTKYVLFILHICTKGNKWFSELFIFVLDLNYQMLSVNNYHLYFVFLWNGVCCVCTECLFATRIPFLHSLNNRAWE